MEFLNKILAMLLKWVPRIVLIQPNEAGLRLTLGTRVKVLAPGYYFFWPVVQEILSAVVATQVVDVRSQSVLSGDGQEMTVSGAIKYKISDIRKAMLEVQDYDLSLQALSLGVIRAVASSLSQERLQDTGVVGDLVLKKIREEASGWGLRLQKVYITDLGRARNIRLLTNGPGVLTE